MRADRLLQIILYLQNHGRMTARELSQKLEVSERTILRDMDTLSGAGVPVLSERGSNGGWRLLEGYRTSLTGMNKEEVQSLMLMHSSRIASELGKHKEYETGLLKLLAALPPSLKQDADQVRQKIHIDGAGWHQSNEMFPYLATIQKAVWAEKKLRFTYPRDGVNVERIAEPLGIVSKGNTWYLVATAEEEIRSYRISRIQNAEMTDISFTRPAGFDLGVYWEQSTANFKASLPHYPAVIRVKTTALPKLRRERYISMKNTLSENANSEGEWTGEWTEVNVHFQTMESACEVVLGYGDQLEVIEPSALRNKVASKIQAMLTLYQTSDPRSLSNG